MSPADKVALFTEFAPMMAAGCMVVTIGWVATTWMRIKHGYPLESSWGRTVYPRDNAEAKERVRLLSQENAQLRAELGSMKDRLANVERIVIDSGFQLTHEIESLRDKPVN